MSFILALLKRIFSFPDLNELGKGFSKSVHHHLNESERKMTIYFVIIILIQLIGFGVVLSCLEDGFHWKYLFKVG